jgi:hypothetical protein
VWKLTEGPVQVQVSQERAPPSGRAQTKLRMRAVWQRAGALWHMGVNRSIRTTQLLFIDPRFRLSKFKFLPLPPVGGTIFRCCDITCLERNRGRDDLPECPRQESYQGRSGLVLLALRFAGVYPKRTFATATLRCAGWRFIDPRRHRPFLGGKPRVLDELRIMGRAQLRSGS